VAAARHVVVCCGPAEIDGHALCTGLGQLKLVKKAIDQYFRAHASLTLIRGAIFRSRSRQCSPAKPALGILPLGELLGMYNTHEATHRHDKIYALLGMATDDVSHAGLSPNYDVPWDELLRRVVMFILGDNLQIRTWKDEEKVEFTGNGWIVGRVLETARKTDGSQIVTVQLNETIWHRGDSSAPWHLRSVANTVCRDDIIYTLEGATHVMIIRRHASTFHVVATAITPPWHLETTSVSCVSRRFTLVWEWVSLNFTPDQYLPESFAELGSYWTVAMILLDLSETHRAEQLISHLVELISNSSSRVNLHSGPVSIGLPSKTLAITEEEVIEIVQRRCLDISLIRSLLTKLRTRICITDRVLIAIARRSDELLADVFDQDTKDFPITPEVIKAVGEGRPDTEYGMTMLMKLLISNWEDKHSLSVKPILIIAARNEWAEELLRHLLKRSSKYLNITDAVLIAAVSNAIECRKAMLQLLLDARGNKDPVSDLVLVAALQSKECHNDAIEFLLARRGLNKEVPEAFWVAAAENRDGDDYSRINEDRARQRFKILLAHELHRRPGTRISITEPILVAVVGNVYNGRKLIDFLFHRYFEFEFVDGIATQRILAAAAENEWNGPDIVKTLLRRGNDDSKICITQSVIAAAMNNQRRGKNILKLLCERNVEAERLYVSMGGQLKDLEAARNTGRKRAYGWTTLDS
jgi:hypothetical protein